MPKIKTHCPFCSMQDTLFIEETPRGEAPTYRRESILNLEYDPESVRGLCARGNYCQELSTHRSRLYKGKIGAEYCSTAKAAGDFGEQLAGLSGERIGILLDASLTLEETAKALALAEKLGTKLVSLLPSEDLAIAPFEPTTDFDRIHKAACNLVIGDAFTLSPTITRLIHDAKATDRKNNFVAVDTIKSRTGWFAHPELIAPLGKTTLLISALADAVEGKSLENLNLEELGVSTDDFEWAVYALKNGSGNGNVIVAPGWHFADPFALCVAAKRLAVACNHGFMPLTIGTGSRGIYRLLSNAGCDMIGTYKALYDRQLDALLAIDCDPTEALPGIIPPELFGITGQLPTDGLKRATHFVPSTYLFEKTGNLLGTEGNIIELNEKSAPPGVLPASDIIDIIFGGKALINSNPTEIISGLPEPEESALPSHKLPSGDIIAVGHPDVLHHADGRYTRRVDFVRLRTPDEVSEVSMSPILAKRFEIKGGDTAVIENEWGKGEFNIKLAEWLPDKIILLPMHHPRARGLFNFANNPAGSPITVSVKKA